MGRVSFTVKRIEDFSCPSDKPQTYLWDTTVTQLGVRVIPAGKPALVFQGLYLGKTVRITIGSPDSWNIAKAQTRARELQRFTDEGRDSRIVVAEASQADKTSRIEQKRSSVHLIHVWFEYLKERKPYWGEKKPLRPSIEDECVSVCRALKRYWPTGQFDDKAPD